jgi:hypothetical protein
MVLSQSDLFRASGIQSLKSRPWCSDWMPGTTAEIALEKLFFQDSCKPPTFLGWCIQAPRNFLGSSSSLALMIFPAYVAVLLLMKDSSFGILQKQNLTYLFRIWSSQTCCHLMLRILLMVLWWKASICFLFLLDRFHISHPKRIALMTNDV